MITGGNEAAYRDGIQRLSEWCAINNLALNIPKRKELILDFRWNKAAPAPLDITGNRVEQVESIKFPAVYISADLSWTANTTALVKKVQQTTS